MSNVFPSLVSLNVNEHTEKKNSGGTMLTYLSWAWAWKEVKSRFPDAKYEIKMFDGLPYVYDPRTGYMVFTTVTIDGISHDMWLPVMDGANHAMKAEPYSIQTKYKEVPVAAATMFDINKTLMRCLVKNLAMFGLGLYIYAGEDLPEDEEETPVWSFKAAMEAFCSAYGIDVSRFVAERKKLVEAGTIENTPASQLTQEAASKLFDLIKNQIEGA